MCVCDGVVTQPVCVARRARRRRRWLQDVGQPKDYITGVGLYLKSLRKRSPERLAEVRSQHTQQQTHTLTRAVSHVSLSLSVSRAMALLAMCYLRIA